MNNLEFKYADKGEQTKKINRFLLLGEMIFSVFSILNTTFFHPIFLKRYTYFNSFSLTNQ